MHSLLARWPFISTRSILTTPKPLHSTLTVENPSRLPSSFLLPSLFAILPHTLYICCNSISSIALIPPIAYLTPLCLYSVIF
ncbi:hypothetical protein BT63DRAFT_3525 [Microthyrium microscopicum]|uniref:Uncharacterized protein n=1 Tax=Microthyrium microscopicum TaxID=703497 RepID=A0A6A6UPI3_9PEZI|nr:hypothetical protein BT63DRAFT_3525 [Microthyrium microscopicum]